jgi:DNA-binding protein HU-beta
MLQTHLPFAARGTLQLGEAQQPIVNDLGTRRMSKKEIIDTIAERAEITKEKAGIALEALTDYVSATLQKGDEVNFAPLGKFKVSDRAAREGRNPMSGEKIKIPASKVPKFTASKQLKDELNPPSKKKK